MHLKISPKNGAFRPLKALMNLNLGLLKMQKLLLFIAILIFGSSGVSAFAQGEKIYRQVCMECHGSGIDKAPKIGDKKRWAPLIAEGQIVLTAHGYVGVRGMPPKGGKEDLSIEDFSAAVNFMVNKSDGHWQMPEKSMMEGINKEIVARELAQKNSKNNHDD